MSITKEVILQGRDKTVFPPDLEFDHEAKFWMATFSSPLALHVYTERFVNKGAYHSFRHYSEVTQKYRPVDGEPSFPLPFVHIHKNDARLYKQNPSDFLTSWMDKGDYLPFFIHPDMLDVYRERGIDAFSEDKIQGELEAIPTASTRTLMVNMDGVLTMVKVDLSGKVLGRLTRQLPERSGIRSNLVASLVDDANQRGVLPNQFGYFPETLAVGFNTAGKSYANIYREYDPTPHADNDKFVIPFFCLYSPDLRYPGNPLIIQQLIDLSGQNPEVFFEGQIAKPFIKNALYMAFKEGLLFEAHPQNCLVALDTNYGITRFLYRDLQTVIIDTDQREHVGLSNVYPPEAKLIGKWQDGIDYKVDYSSFYDHRIAYQTLEEVIIAIANKYPSSLTSLQRRMKKAFGETVDELNVDPDKYFPRDKYYLYQDGLMKDNKMIPVAFPDPPYR